MIIKWNENPLKTVIELDEFEEKEFKYKVDIQELKDRISYAIYLVDSDEIDPDDKLSRIKSALEDREGWFIKEYINSLSDIHCGDCTCIPCSCTKCFSECILGVDTIKGLRKHEANAVCSAFGNGRNIDEAIKILKEYNPANPPPGSWRDKHPDLWDSSVDRWIKEARSAADWLEKYKDEHKEDFQ